MRRTHITPLQAALSPAQCGPHPSHSTARCLEPSSVWASSISPHCPTASCLEPSSVCAAPISPHGKLPSSVRTAPFSPLSVGRTHLTLLQVALSPAQCGSHPSYPSESCLKQFRVGGTHITPLQVASSPLQCGLHPSVSRGTNHDDYHGRTAVIKRSRYFKPSSVWATPTPHWQMSQA